MKTRDRAAVMCCKASADSRGKPTTTPSATVERLAMSREDGRAPRCMPSRIKARIPAMAARAAVRNTGSKPAIATRVAGSDPRSEEHTSELQSLMRISYAVFCLKKKKTNKTPLHACQTTHIPEDQKKQ